MADYERRVYYIYDYSNRHRGDNKGYIILENKFGQWKQQIFLKDKNIYRSCDSAKLTFAWYVWNDEKILAAQYCCSKCNDKKSGIEQDIDPGNVLGAKLDEISGLIIKNEEGSTYAAAFDDREYEPDFVTYVDTLRQPEKPEYEKVEKQESKKTGSQKPESKREEAPAPIEENNITTIKDNVEVGTLTGEDTTLEIQEVPEFLKVTRRKTPERIKYEKTRYMRINDWRDLFKKYEEVEPFDDDVFCQCVEICKEDLQFLPPSCGNVANNSFLLHGLFNYRHLLLGQCKCKKRQKVYILGVPGRYINSERKLAGMYGFYNFKAARRLGTRTENFGYWYIMFSE